MKANKIISFILAFVLLAGVFNSVALAEQSTLPQQGSYDQPMLEVLQMLEIADASNTGKITRAQFAKAAAKLAALDTIGFGGTLPFADIAPESEYYNVIGTLHTLGVISSAPMFYPDNIVAETEALKILVSILGYDDHARAKGGWSAGYISVASSLDITPSFDGDGLVSFGEMVEMLYNCLFAEVRHVAIGSGESHADVTVLETYHDLISLEGQINAVDRSGLINANDKTYDNTIRIDDRLFDISSVPQLRDYLGYRINAYISTDDSDNKIYAYEMATENVQKISAYEAELNLSQFKISVDEKDYVLSKDYQVVFNGVAMSDFTQSTLEFEDGEYILIDSNNDRRYDVVNVWKTEYVVVDTFTADGSVVTDKNKKKYGPSESSYLDFSNNDVMYDFCIDKSGSISPCSLSELSSAPLLAVYVGADEKYIKVIGIDNTVKGVVDGISATTIEMNATEYQLTAYAKSVSISVGGQGVLLLLDSFGRAVAVSDQKDSMSYGYIMQLKEGGGFEGRSAYVLCANGEKATFKFKDSVILDGSSANVAAAVGESKIKNYQFIRYLANSEEELVKIDTASSSDLYADGLPADNNLRLYYNEVLEWYSNSKMLLPGLAPRSSAIFCVPTAVKDAASIAQYKFNSDDFYVGSVSEFGTGQEIDIDASVYDVMDNGDFGAMVRFTDSNPNITLTTLSHSSRVGVVDEVSMGINADGEPVRKISIARVTGYKHYYFSKLLDTTFTNENRKIAPGDIVRYEEMGDTLTNLRVEFSRNDWKMDSSLESDYRFGEYGQKGIVYYHIGKIYNLDGGYALIRDEYDGVVKILSYTNTTVLKYDPALNSIKPVDAGSVLTECAVGASLANKAVAITRYAEDTYILVIYE